MYFVINLSFVILLSFLLKCKYSDKKFKPVLYLYSFSKFNINDATRGITQADIQRHEIEVQTFIESNINRLPHNAARNHRNQ